MIHDHLDDYNLGTVTFVPFLNEINSQAMPNLTVPTSNPTPNISIAPSQNSTVTPIQPVSGDSVFFGLGWIGVALVALLVAIVVLLVFVVVYLHGRSSKT